MLQPSISIVTAVLNRADTIATAVDSVRRQRAAVLEHIVIDGGSTDGTLDALSAFPHLVVRSEPDKGVYDALNKGLAMARGELVLFLNSDDLLPEGSLDAIAAAAAGSPRADIICGGALLSDMQGRIVRNYSGAAARAMTYDLFLLRPAIMNARAFRRQIIDRVGCFDTSYRLAADHDYMIRCARAGATHLDLDRVVYIYRQHPASLTFDPTGRNVARISEELMGLADRWYRAPGADAALRTACRLRYGRSTLTLMRLALTGGNGGRLDALLRDHAGRIGTFPVRCALEAMWAWGRDAPYARER